MGFSFKMQVMSYSFHNRKSYFDSFKTFEVIDAESPIVIFFGTYGIDTSQMIILWQASQMGIPEK